MGYRYGEHKYSEGLYSRWPDWWHDKRCRLKGWDVNECAPEIWNPPDPGVQMFETIVCAPLSWTPAVGVEVPPWEKGDQQAVLKKQAVRWGRTR